MQTCNLATTIYWRCCTFSSMYFWPLNKKRGLHKCMDLCLGLQFYSIEHYVRFMIIKCFIYHYSFIVQLEIMDSDTSSSSFMFMIVLAIQGFCIHYETEIVLLGSGKNSVNFLNWLLDNFGRMAIFTTCLIWVFYCCEETPWP